MSVYICPETKAELKQLGSILTSNGDGRSYDIHNGIPKFLRYDALESEEIETSLQRLNDIAKTESWRKALIEVYGEDSNMYQYVTDTRRLKFLDLLSLKDQNIVLEIGTGLGQLTTAIAKRVKTVYGLEVVAKQAEFTLERCKQEGLSNVQVASGGEDCWLPYTNNTFDVVVINLVLEWCASRDNSESPLILQRRILSEIQRVLKDGGIVYLVTKNRYSLHYLLGKPDEHSYGMLFGNALPRWLLYFLLRMQGKSRPRGLLHSYNKLKAMLSTAGFVEIKSFWAAPEMRYPLHYIPTDSSSIRLARRQNNFVQGQMKSTNLIMQFIPNALIKYFTPGLVFIAKKPC